MGSVLSEAQELQAGAKDAGGDKATTVQPALQRALRLNALPDEAEILHFLVAAFAPSGTADLDTSLRPSPTNSSEPELPSLPAPPTPPQPLPVPPPLPLPVPPSSSPLP